MEEDHRVDLGFENFVDGCQKGSNFRKFLLEVFMNRLLFLKVGQFGSRRSDLYQNNIH